MGLSLFPMVGVAIGCTVGGAAVIIALLTLMRKCWKVSEELEKKSRAAQERRRSLQTDGKLKNVGVGMAPEGGPAPGRRASAAVVPMAAPSPMKGGRSPTASPMKSPRSPQKRRTGRDRRMSVETGSKPRRNSSENPQQHRRRSSVGSAGSVPLESTQKVMALAATDGDLEGPTSPGEYSAAQRTPFQDPHASPTASRPPRRMSVNQRTPFQDALASPTVIVSPPASTAAKAPRRQSLGGTDPVARRQSASGGGTSDPVTAMLIREGGYSDSQRH